MTEKRLMFVIVCCSGMLTMAQCCHQSEWSNWINEYKPSNTPLPSEVNEPHLTNTGGDIENMTPAAREAFCPAANGNIDKIECVTADANETNFADAQEMVSPLSKGLVCSISGGFKCMNRLLKGATMCLDYKMRLHCNCANPQTTPTRLVSTGGATDAPKTQSGGGSFTTITASRTVAANARSTPKSSMSNSGSVSTSGPNLTQPTNKPTSGSGNKVTTAVPAGNKSLQNGRNSAVQVGSAKVVSILLLCLFLSLFA